MKMVTVKGSGPRGMFHTSNGSAIHIARSDGIPCCKEGPFKGEIHYYKKGSEVNVDFICVRYRRSANIAQTKYRELQINWGV